MQAGSLTSLAKQGHLSREEDMQVRYRVSDCALGKLIYPFASAAK
jgi:hypothetical protein